MGTLENSQNRFAKRTVGRPEINTCIAQRYAQQMTRIHPLTDECWSACYHDGDIDKVIHLLESGVDINARAPCSGAAPLDAALHGGHVSLAEFLLEKGADPNGIGYDSGTPLMAAVNYQLIDATKLLLEYGADANLASPLTGETPLHIAALRGFAKGSTECVKLLLTAGANPNVPTKVNVETPSLASGTTVCGETPLHFAAAFGDEEMVRALVEAGADVHARNNHGDSALVWFGRHQRSAQHLIIPRGERREIMELLSGNDDRST